MQKFHVFFLLFAAAIEILSRYLEILYKRNGIHFLRLCVVAVVSKYDRFIPFRKRIQNYNVLDVTKKRYRQAVARAQELNINKIVLHAGYQPLVYYPEWFLSRSQEFWRDFVQEIPDGMTVCLENVMEPEPSYLTGIIRAVGDPRLRICLDLGHANTCVSKVPAADWLSACAPYLSHVHLHNNNGDRDLHAALFDGTLDIAALLRQLHTQAPAATCTLELMQAGPSLAWLQKQNILE